MSLLRRFASTHSSIWRIGIISCFIASCGQEPAKSDFRPTSLPNDATAKEKFEGSNSGGGYTSIEKQSSPDLSIPTPANNGDDDSAVTTKPSITLMVAAEEIFYREPAGLAEVTWETELVKSCVLRATTGEELSRELSGAMAVDISGHGKITLSCDDENGDIFTKSVDVYGTTPSLVMTANGKSGSIVVEAGSQVNLEWTGSDADFCSVVHAPTSKHKEWALSATPLIQNYWTQGTIIGDEPTGSATLVLTSGTTVLGHCEDYRGHVFESMLEIKVN